MTVTATDRIRRLLAVLAFIQSAGDPTVAEVARRFSMSEHEVLDELNLAQMIGADSPDLEDMPFEVVVDGDHLSVFLHAFDRPLRLAPAEALALVAAASALLDAQEDETGGPLASAIAKLARVLDVDPADQLDVDLGVPDPAAFATVERAVAGHRALEIDYDASGTNARTHRVVEPWRMFHDRGAWYLAGHCRLAGAERVFRIDRIRDPVVLEEVVVAPSGLAPPRAFSAGDEAPRVVLDLPPSGHWVAESYPVDQVEERPHDRLRVRLPVSATPWLERLLLRLGPDAILIEADQAFGPEHPGAAAARRLIERYRR